MTIQAIPVNTPEGTSEECEPEVVMLKVSGSVDPSDAVVIRARGLVLKTGSPAMIESFDWALKSGALLAEE